MRQRTWVTTLGIIGGLFVLLMVAAAGCDDSEPRATEDLTVPPLGFTATPEPVPTNAPTLAPMSTPAPTNTPAAAPTAPGSTATTTIPPTDVLTLAPTATPAPDLSLHDTSSQGLPRSASSQDSGRYFAVKLLWSRGIREWPVSTDDIGGYELVSPPAVSDGVIYIGSRHRRHAPNHIYALDASSGELLWNFQLGFDYLSSPLAADGGAVYVGSGNGRVYALDALTGKRQWIYETGGTVPVSPGVVDGVVYVGSRNGHVYALDASSGEILWSFDEGVGVFSYPFSPPMVVDGVVYVGQGRTGLPWDGYVHALDASTGAVLWSDHTDGVVYTSPAVADRVAYVSTVYHEGSRHESLALHNDGAPGDGAVHALDSSTGKLLWSYQTDRWVDSSPVVVGGKAYVISRSGHLHALDASTGGLLWSYQTDERFASSPVVVNGIAYIGSKNGHLYALETSTGELSWTYEIGGGAPIYPAVVDGIVYATSQDGKVYALKATVVSKPVGTTEQDNASALGPAVKLMLDAEATVTGYWSDGTANVKLAVTLHNVGNLGLDHAVEIIATCSQHGDVINGCGSKSSLSLPGGLGPASDTLTLRVPTGDVSLTVTYGERGTERLDLNVPERILGVDRDVWECFSDTSKAGTIWEDDEGIGCGAWSGDPLQKWDQTSPLKVFIKGPDGFVVEFKDVLNDLSPVVNLQFEWVDAEYHADVSAYIGMTVPALESQGVYCLNLEAFGCANTKATRGEVVRGEIIVFNLWPDQGVEFGDFGDRRRADFRSAMIHEAVHALARMSHRTELLSMMNQAVSHKAELSPMDEALLRLQGYELVKPGMTMADIGSQIVFNDELMDPQPVDPRFASWWFVSNAYRELRDATSASFRVRSSFPGCSEEFGWADYEVGNLTGHHPYFGWVRIDDGENHVYTLQPYSGQLERWKQSESGWFEIRRDEFSDAMPGWRGDLSDPHHLLESILYYGDWANAELSIHPRGQVTLRTKLDTVRGHAPSSMERVEVVLIIDGETYAILEYSMEWKLGGDTCDTYEVQARAGQYSVEFAFPDEVRQGSRFLDSCDVESLGPLEGYVRRSGHWARECGLGRTVGDTLDHTGSRWTTGRSCVLSWRPTTKWTSPCSRRMARVLR